MKGLIGLLSAAAALGNAPLASSANVRVYPAPAGEGLSKDFTVQVEGQEVPVYVAKVAPAEPARRR